MNRVHDDIYLLIYSYFTLPWSPLSGGTIWEKNPTHIEVEDEYAVLRKTPDIVETEFVKDEVREEVVDEVSLCSYFAFSHFFEP